MHFHVVRFMQYGHRFDCRHLVSVGPLTTIDYKVYIVNGGRKKGRLGSNDPCTLSFFLRGELSPFAGWRPTELCPITKKPRPSSRLRGSGSLGIDGMEDKDDML